MFKLQPTIYFTNSSFSFFFFFDHIFFFFFLKQFCAVFMWSISRYGKSFEDAVSLLEWSALPARAALEPRQVRIAVKAAALNFFDLLAMCKFCFECQTVVA